MRAERDAIIAVERRLRIVAQVRVIRRGRGGGLLPLPFAGSGLPERDNARLLRAGTK
jgi:hypothetical protein